MKKGMQQYGLGIMVIVYLLSIFGCSFLNSYESEGRLPLPGLKAEVTVKRDEKGMPYIYASNPEDALTGLGFVAAQDRLFQMELIRLFAEGRISELAGEKTREIDIRHRTIGFRRQAEKHAALLDDGTRAFFQHYLDGVNAYIQQREDSRPLEFFLSGLKPQPWTLEDELSIFYFLGWNSAANLKTEIVAQMLVEKLGSEKAREIFPLNINPDDPAEALADRVEGIPDILGLNPGRITAIFAAEQNAWSLGSNNWTVAGARTVSGKPIVANDPHLDARMLPGPWYPAGIVLPENRMVGAMIAGLPLMTIFRSTFLAAGVTNAYGDTQDLYVETVDPADSNRYLEGDRSIQFDVIHETLRIRDKDAENGYRTEPIEIRLTRRGPVVSHIWPHLKTDKVLTLRYAPFETMRPSVGVTEILNARTAADMRQALENVTPIMLNYVFADQEGHIGWQVSGTLPIRESGDGTIPHPVGNGTDNWHGWVPFDQMPGETDPDKGWLGTCNHKIVKQDYPYYFSSHFASSWRYRRLKELMAQPEKTTASDHWQYQRDTLNILARETAPVMARVLDQNEKTRGMAQILSQWDYHDDPQQVGPMIFHAVFDQFARLTFTDELGEDLAAAFFENWYFWQERLLKMTRENRSEWFDNVLTPDTVESRDDLLLLAGLEARKMLEERLGSDMQDWQWGRLHWIEFVHPIRRQGFGKGLLGGCSYPAPGSVDTLYRGIHAFKDPFQVTISASLRMVADLGDDEKVMAVLPGGVTGRMFNPHQTDQLDAFMNGEPMYWWFSDAAIQSHTQAELVLTP